MDIFISWSGHKSGELAKHIKDWLPNVIQVVKPWISKEGEKGKAWQTEIAGKLEKCFFGIVCVTQDNMVAPWLNFEAGALSKTVSESNVCTVLFGLRPTDVVQPLGQFQATSVDNKEDMFFLLKTINDSLEDGLRLNEQTLEASFEKWWPDLENKLSEIPENVEFEQRSDTEMIEEVLTTVRGMSKTISDLNNDIENKKFAQKMAELTSEAGFISQSGLKSSSLALTREQIFKNLQIPLPEGDG